MKTTILFRIESPEGDTQIGLPEDEAPKKVNELVNGGNWATLEKEDGTSQTITKPVPVDNWKDTFTGVKQVNATSKVKGG